MSPTDGTTQRTVVERLSYAREVVRMNFDEALLAHADWKLKLHLFIQGEGHFDADVVSRDNQCPLGKWIYSDGMKYANDPDYETLRRNHSLFHSHTAAIVRVAASGDAAAARAMLTNDSAFASISAAVSEAISQMKRRVDEKIGLIMSNVAVGILVVDPTLLVQSGYSHYCHELLSARRIGGRHICELLRLQHGHFELVEGALRQAFEDVLPPEVSLAMLPERVVVDQRVVGVRATALRSTDHEVDYIIFTLDDATRLVELEAERAEGMALVRALRNRHAFALFARDARQRLSELIGSGYNAARVRRDVHTIKGNAGLFDLKSVVRCAGDIEDQPVISDADLERLRLSLNGALEHFESALGFNLLDEERASVTCDESTLRRFEREFVGAPDEPARTRLFHSLVRRLRMRTVRSILGPIEERVALLAEKFEKKIDCQVLGDQLLVSEHKVGPVLQALAHAIRNAIDHGIEPHRERLGKGKSSEGKLVLGFETNHEHGLRLVLSDDGRGIDVPALRARALERGLLTAEALAQLSVEQQLDLVFADGLSTAHNVSEVSGRGVGMSALREAVEQAGGSLRLSTEPSQGTRIEVVIADAALAP